MEDDNIKKFIKDRLDYYDKTNLEYKDLNNGDMDSEELESTNKRSPVEAFKGYPR